jgi:hypothetical protein
VRGVTGTTMKMTETDPTNVVVEMEMNRTTPRADIAIASVTKRMKSVGKEGEGLIERKRPRKREKIEDEDVVRGMKEMGGIRAIEGSLGVIVPGRVTDHIGVEMSKASQPLRR